MFNLKKNCMKKQLLFFFLLLGLCGCANQPASEDNQSTPVDTKSVVTKTVKEYIESNEFIDIIPEQAYQEVNTRSVNDQKALNYQMMAVMYRFYKHCTMDEAGIISCHITSGKEINVSEEAFEMRIKEMHSWNDRIREKIRNGVNYKVVRIDDKYFDNLLNFK